MKSESEVVEFLNSLLPLDRSQVTEFLFPFDTAAWRKEYMKSNVSTCALTSMAYFRFLGLTDPELVKPYQKQMGMAVANVVTVSRRHKAWLTGSDLLSFPEIGDIVLIGSGPTEHVLNVLGATDGTSLVSSLDGGQGNPSTIAHRERMMVFWNGLAYLVDPTTPYKNGVPAGRPIMGRMSFKKLMGQ